MADDDSFSLDFTLPRAIVAPEETPVAPAPTAKPALELVNVDDPSPASPAPTAVPPEPPPYPAALIEAAELHAAGKSLDAMRRLEQAIKSREDLGRTPQNVWGGLFDVLQFLNRRPAFDSLALAFAKHFGRSPPTWSGPDAASDRDATSSNDTVVLKGSLNVSTANALKQVTVLAQKLDGVKVDLGGLFGADNTGATLMLRLLAAMRKARKQVDFIRPERLAAALRSMIEVGKREDQEIWLLLLELFQQMGQQDDYEETALNYAVTFEVSPPAWVPPGATSQAESADAADNSSQPLRGMLTNVGADTFHQLDGALAADGPIEIDAREWQGIDAVSAANLLAILKPITDQAKAIRLVQLSPLVAASLYTHGFADLVELRVRPF